MRAPCSFRISPILAMAAASCAGIFAMSAAAQDASLFSRLPANIQATKVIRMVGDSFPPYRIVGDDGKVTGVETDLARALEPVLGVKIEQTVVNGLPAIIAGIDTGRYELSSGPLLSTKAREERYDILPWLLSKPAYILPSSAAAKVKRLEDLCGMRVAFSAGSVSEEYQKMLTHRCTAAGLPALRDVALQEKDTTVLAMQSGRADAASIQLAAAKYLQHLSPDKYHVQTDQTDVMGVLNLGFVLKKGSPLSPVLLDAMKRLQASGQYTQILSKWGLETTQQTVMRLNPATSEGAK